MVSVIARVVVPLPSSSAKVGGTLSLVAPDPGSDQPLSPSRFLAFTCTWWVFPATSPVMVSVRPAPVWFHGVQLPEVPSRYCRS